MAINDQGKTLIPLSLYSELIKVRQTSLLIFTSIFAYLITGYPDRLEFGIFFVLLVSLFFAVSGSTLLNMYIDRDIDTKMERTRGRALPVGKISPRTVLYHGILFSILGVLLAYFINSITMLVIFGGVFFDVGIYSLWLKRKSKWSIIFGGVSGGAPALAGRTSITASVDLVGILFLLIIVFWIPLHILTLATLSKNLEGYRTAKIPMWPVVSGVRQTQLVISIATILEGMAIVATSWFIEIHWLSIVPTIIMAGVMISLAFKNLKNPTEVGTLKLFKFASIFMALTFLYLFVASIISPQLYELI